MRRSDVSFLTATDGGVGSAAVLALWSFTTSRPVAAGGEVWDETNVNELVAICRQCHIEKTASSNKRDKSATEIRWQALVDSLSTPLRKPGVDR